MIIISARLAVVAAALLALLAVAAAPTQSASAGGFKYGGGTVLDSRILRAVFAEDRLWLLGSDGQLWSMTEAGEWIDVATPDRVIELFVQHGHAAIVTCPGDSCTQWTPNARWTLRGWRGNDWETTGEIVTRGEDFVTAIAAGDTTTLLTVKRMINLADGIQTETALSWPSSVTSSHMFDPLQPLDQQRPKTPFPFPLTYLYRPEFRPTTPLKAWPVGAVLVTSKHIFVGYSVGEWGGGLKRIDRLTGILSEIEDVDGDLCGGNLNPACDAVNGIAIIPWRPDCIAVAIGLIHMSSHGRMVEVCDNAVRPLYTHEIQAHPATTPGGPDRIMWTTTTAFFGLQQTGEDLLAMGHDGLYQISRGDTVRQIPLPHFKDVDGVAVSFDIPGLVLVLTTANRRFSVSSSTPMLVPR
ncbi:hypothetical protein [Bradyrhizobium oligotrophicum]|uniref:hypothetical protein n=1 Tax=Bradyrhizobium oligotrophicum TaxID=44255 RepID=UPI003EB76DBE